MKEKLLNNFGLKVVSLVLAFIVWMAVVNISNPVIDDSQIVTVEVRNDKVLEDENLTYEIVGKDTITVSYQVRTRERSLVKASDFHAYIDLKDYNVTGAVPVTVEINKDKESLIKSDTVSAKPMVIRIRTEELQRKKFDLHVTTKGTPEEGYALGTISLSPDYVIVEGPISQVGQISHMGVEVEVDNANSDITATAAPVFYDANGNTLNVGDKVTVNRPEINCQVSVLKAKNLALSFDVTGQVANGYRFTGVESDLKSVSVVGTKSVLASVTTLPISSDKLNIDGATSDRKVELNLSEYLPPNTFIVGEDNKSVTVTLKIEPLKTKVFTINLEKLGKSGGLPGYKYSFDKPSSDITIKGLEEDLETLDEKDLKAELEVGGLEPGTHNGRLSLTPGEGFEVVGYSPFTITIVSEEEETSSEEPESTVTADNAETGESQQTGETDDKSEAVFNSEPASEKKPE